MIVLVILVGTLFVTVTSGRFLRTVLVNVVVLVSAVTAVVYTVVVLTAVLTTLLYDVRTLVLVTYLVSYEFFSTVVGIVTVVFSVRIFDLTQSRGGGK